MQDRKKETIEKYTSLGFKNYFEVIWKLEEENEKLRKELDSKQTKEEDDLK